MINKITKKEGAPYGNHNAYKTGKHTLAFRLEEAARGRFDRECRDTLKTILQDVKGIMYEVNTKTI